jgi:hypothetical protein
MKSTSSRTQLGGEAPNLAARVFRSRGPHFKRTIRAGPSRLKIWFDLLLFINLLARLARQRYDVLYAHEEGALLARLAGPFSALPTFTTCIPACRCRSRTGSSAAVPL